MLPRRRALAVVAGFVVSLVASLAEGAGLPQTSETDKIIRVGYLPATHDALLFVAKEMQLYDASRLDLELRSYDNSVQILNDLRSGVIDVGIPGIATPAKEIGAKAPLTIIGGAAARSAALVAQAGLASQILEAKTVSARVGLLRGKRVGAVRGSTGLAIFRKGLRDAGVDTGDFDLREYTKPSEITNDLAAGVIDAGLLWSPHMTLAEARKERTLKTALWMSEILPNHICCRQVARDAVLSKKAAIVAYLVGLLKADRAIRLAQGNPSLKGPVQAAVKKYIPNLSDAQMDRELFGSDAWTTVSPVLDPDGIGRYLDAMEAAGEMRSDQCLQVKQKIRTEYMEAAYRELGCTPEIAHACLVKKPTECECTRID